MNKNIDSNIFANSVANVLTECTFFLMFSLLTLSYLRFPKINTPVPKSGNSNCNDLGIAIL